MGQRSEIDENTEAITDCKKTPLNLLSWKSLKFGLYS